MASIVTVVTVVYAAYSYVGWAKGVAKTAWSTWQTFRRERLEHSLRAFRKACEDQERAVCGGTRAAVGSSLTPPLTPPLTHPPAVTREAGVVDRPQNVRV